MPFPEFEAGKKRVLFFSRGRGRGHAVPDIAIFHALTTMRGDVDVRFVSYGTGAETFRAFDISIVDLDLPDSGSIVDTSVLAGKLIGWLDPDLVIVHEEFAAIPAARIFDKRTIVLTDWFLASEGYAMNSLKFSDEILFLGQEGVYEEPSWLRGRVSYLGPLVRPFQYEPGDRSRARHELGIPQDATVLSVFPGSWPESQAPLLDAVIEAFDSLPQMPKRLIWLTGSDAAVVNRAIAGRQDAASFETYWDIDRLMVASDVAVTKANRKTVFELQYLAVPTIAVTFSLNPGDDAAIVVLKSVVRVPGRGLTGAELHRAISGLLLNPQTERDLKFASAQQCAERICEAL